MKNKKKLEETKAKLMGLKVLLVDIETAPLLNYCWGIWDQNISLNQIKSDWYLLSWSAKYLGKDKILYMDQRNAKNIENDKSLLKGIWKLLNDCDILVTQNGKKFDIKKLNARFILNGMKPPSSFKHIDTCQIARTKFGFTSNKLEYLTDKLCKKYKKLKHKKFPGFEMWSECLKGNQEAWKEMQKYNEHDVLSLEELYLILQPWDNSINPNLYSEDNDTNCSCGSSRFKKNGFKYTSVGKYQRYCCKKCGAETRGRKNLFSPEKKKSLKVKS